MMKKNRTNHGRSPYGTWKCRYCNIIFDTRQKLFVHIHEKHNYECIYYGQMFESGHQLGTHTIHCKLNPKYNEIRKSIDSKTSMRLKGKHLSEEHKRKTSASMKKFFKEHPDRVPYVLNHSSKESYPEQYFRTVFINEQFPKFVQDKYVDGYYLDFAFEDLKMYVEVDGEQHYVDQKIVEHDKIRKAALDTTEWTCIVRIRWSKFKKLSDEQKHRFVLNLKNKLISNTSIM